MSAEGELMLTILSSFAQEESLSVSENVKWRVRKDFKEGRVCGMTMLGYHLVDGILTVIPEEAELVRAIFNDYLSGLGIVAIVKKLRKQGIKFSRSGIAEMLRNEKYQGDMLLQKSFVSDHITKRKVRNIGQLPKYHVTDSHAPIIDRETFAKVQAEISRRSANHKPNPPQEPHYPFTGIIRCGRCGAPYKRKHFLVGTKYQKYVWICPTFDQLGKDECGSQQIPEDILTAKTIELLHLESLDDINLRASIAEIRVPEHNLLVYVFHDGHEVEVPWENPSRRQSWTPEMREQARQRALNQHHGE
jgi:hypothetical protein